MKAAHLMFLSAALGTMASMPAAFAATSLTKACKTDLKKFGCTAKADAEANECLEKNEKEGQKNEGFTQACYKAHEAFEKKSGLGNEEKERGEHHQESTEEHG